MKRIFALLIVISLLFSLGKEVLAAGIDVQEYLQTVEAPEMKGLLNNKAQSRVSVQGLINNSVTQIVPDGKGGTWIGTISGLTHLKSDRSFQNFSMREGLSDNFITALEMHGGEVWAGSLRSVIQMKNDVTPKPYFEGETLNKLRVNRMYTAPNGNFWLITNAGLWGFAPNGDLSFGEANNARLPVQEINTIAYDDDGVFWAGGHGIFRAEVTDTAFPDLWHRKWTSSFPQDSINLWVNVIKTHGKQIYVGTNRGLFVYNKSSDTWRHISEPLLSDTQVLDIAIGSDGMIWLATAGGATRMSPDLSSSFTFTVANGLPDSRITTLALENDGTIWVGTRLGAAKLPVNGKQWMVVDENGIRYTDFNLSENQSKEEQSQRQRALEEQKRQESAARVEATKAERAKLRALVESHRRIFTDIPEEAPWAAESVFGLLDAKILTPSDRYFPHTPVSKEGFIKVVITAMGETVDPTLQFVPYLDVPNDHWAVPYLATALSKGILDKSKTFGLGQPITRYEAADILTRAFKLSPNASSANKFPDLSDAQKGSVGAVVTAGIMKGFDEEVYKKIFLSEQYGIPQRWVPASNSAQVRAVQQALKDLGFFQGEPTGNYDQGTINAVRAYQVSRKLVAKGEEGFGVFGTKTAIRFAQEFVEIGVPGEKKYIFKPDLVVTRAETAKMIWILRGKK